MENRQRDFGTALVGFEGALFFDEPLARHTTFNIGGAAGVLAYPASFTDLKRLLSAAQTLSIPYFVIGAGSNLLVDDRGYDGLVISLERGFGQVTSEGLRVQAGAGARLAQLVRFCAQHGLTGLEFLTGIPASVGGAVCGNAGAFGHAIGEKVVEVRALDPSGAECRLARSAVGFAYRHTALNPTLVVIEVAFELGEAPRAEIEVRMAEITELRRQHHPTLPSAGCIFRNPPGQSAGKLIDEVGAKNLAVGDAVVSAQHANFIVNRGHATFRDVRVLMEEVRQRVALRTGVLLENEVCVVEHNSRPPAGGRQDTRR